jgi:hypothetical protein
MPARLPSEGLATTFNVVNHAFELVASAKRRRDPKNINRTRASTGGKCMKPYLTTLLVGGSLVAISGAALAHHSFAMFDQEHPIQLSGTVKEFRYTSPHTFIILEVKDKDGTNQLWNLEGGAPSGLIRDGWSSKTLKPGDELQLSVDPLRSGAPGGA